VVVGSAVAVVVVFALSCTCLIVSDTREARRAEGEQLLGSAVDAIRVQMSKTERPPIGISSFTPIAGYRGEYFSVGNVIYADGQPVDPQTPTPNGSRWIIVAIPVNPEDGWGIMSFEAKSWAREVEWFDKKPDCVRD
jgi:hypothetical protein